MATAAWAINGNTGTLSQNNFLGTIDNESLVIKTGNVERIVVDTSGNMSILGEISCGSTIQTNIAVAIGQGENAVFLGTPSPPPSQPTLAIDAAVVAISGGLSTSGAESHMAAGTYSDPNPNVLRDLKLGANGLAINGGLVVNTGAVGIGTVSPQHELDVSEDIGVSGNINATNINVTGDVLLTGADCAENFNAADGVSPEPGTVVVIDGEGNLRESREPYDKKVAGVVSGAGDLRHGILLDSSRSQEQCVPLALTGKVYCKVDAAFGAISVGDLLTTSQTPGHAMKVTDVAKAFGAVIGKALRALERGQGLVPILVSLQ